MIAALIILWPFSVDARGGAALFLNPSAASFLLGSTFNLSIILDTKGAPANTVEVELSFPSDKIQLVNPSVGQSVIQIWAAPPQFSNREGKIYFVGGIPAPGIVTSSGIILTLSFRVIAPGSGEIKFGERTSVLANDGKGTNFLEQKRPAFLKFLIPPPQGPEISSPSHPDQEKWYRDNNPIFIWPKSVFSTGFSYSIDRDPTGIADTAVDGTDATASFQNLKSGIWYFHLRERGDGVWGGLSTYVVKIDNDLPADFEVEVSPSKRTADRNPVFRFFTTDASSGFDHFEMKIIPLSETSAGEFFFFEVTPPYQAIDLKPGRYEILVRAVDRAGNTRDRDVTVNIVSAFFQFLTPEGIDLAFIFIPWNKVINFLAIFAFIIMAALLLLWRRHKHHLAHAFTEDLKNVFSRSKIKRK